MMVDLVVVVLVELILLAVAVVLERLEVMLLPLNQVMEVMVRQVQFQVQV